MSTLNLIIAIHLALIFPSYWFLTTALPKKFYSRLNLICCFLISCGPIINIFLGILGILQLIAQGTMLVVDYLALKFKPIKNFLIWLDESPY